MIWLAVVALLLALLPAAMVFKNLQLFRKAPRVDLESMQANGAETPTISIIIPARNEEQSIGAALESILQWKGSTIEVIVVDDHSDDRTAEIIDGIASQDARVRRLPSAPLPSNWNGKQHACWQGAKEAQLEWLLFLDADVRLSGDAIPRIAKAQQLSGAPLISGFPFQETGTLAEDLLIPLMYFVLLGYLPIDRMRASSEPGFAAGCGQLFFANRNAYEQCGGHQTISGSRHDGIKLPRAFRTAGLASDLFDASDIARCRMYTSTTQVVRGLLKNASEGIANWKLIGPFTVLLLGGSVLPLLALLHCWYWRESVLCWTISGIAFVLSMLPRAMCTKAFRQSWRGAILHPFSIACFVAIQWIAFVSSSLGFKVRWRGRN